MAGRHRAPKPPARVPWRPLIWILVALLPALALTGRALLQEDEPEPPIPPVSTPGTPATPTTPTRPLPQIAESQPRQLTSGQRIDVGFDNAREPDSAGVFSAETDERVARWRSRAQPASPGQDTVVVTGRVKPGASLGRLGALTTGDRISIRTDNGTLVYTVQSNQVMDDDGLAQDPKLARQVPGRLVLVGNLYDSAGDRSGRSRVVVAVLTAAQPA